MQTLVRMWDGSCKKIFEIKPGDEICGVTEQGIVKSVVRGSWSAGEKLTYLCRFGHNEIRCTSDHPIAITTQAPRASLRYIQSKDLYRERVCVYRGHDSGKVSCPIACWLGMMASDGSFLMEQCPSFTVCDDRVREKFIGELKKVTDIPPVIDPHGSGVRVRMPSGSYGVKGSNEVKGLLMEFFGLGKKSERKFPVEIWTWDSQSRWKFIEGLLEGDGNIYFPKSNRLVKSPVPCITFNCGASESFSKGIKCLLESVGVQVSIEMDGPTNHQIRVYRHESVNRILEKVNVSKWPEIELKQARAGWKRKHGCGLTSLLDRDLNSIIEETWDLETTTGNFFANDILVHNSGKDFTCWMHIIEQCINRPGIYFYGLPTYRQGKKAIWDAIGNDGKKFLDYIPKEFIEGQPNNTEMKVRFTTGSISQVVGADDPDSLRGTNPRGVVLSEYSRMNPRIWDEILRPILNANDGWIIFNSTPNGRNHFKDLFDMATLHPEAWYASRLTVRDTKVVPEALIQQDIKEGMSEEMAQQEYYCDFNLGSEGTYYGRLMEQVRAESRIGHVPYDRSAPVYTSWDLGFGDSTAIIFFQLIGAEVRIIDCYEASGYGIEHYANTLDDRPYRYAKHFAPHDVEHGGLQTGVSLKEVAQGLGLKFTTLGRHAFQYGIEQARITLPFCHFDEVKCKRLIKCLEQYQRRYNKSMEMYADEPLHNELSHMADAFRYLAIARHEIKNAANLDPNKYNNLS